MKNFLYTLLFEKFEGVKIGITNNPKQRIKTLEISHGKVIFSKIYETDLAQELETLFHSSFRKFNLSDKFSSKLDGYTEFFSLEVLENKIFKSIIELYDLKPIILELKETKTSKVVNKLPNKKIILNNYYAIDYYQWDQYFNESLKYLKYTINNFKIMSNKELYFMYNNCFLFNSTNLGININPFVCYSTDKISKKATLKKHKNKISINEEYLYYFDEIKIYEYWFLTDLIHCNPEFESESDLVRGSAEYCKSNIGNTWIVDKRLYNHHIIRFSKNSKNILSKGLLDNDNSLFGISIDYYNALTLDEKSKLIEDFGGCISHIFVKYCEIVGEENLLLFFSPTDVISSKFLEIV